MSRQADAMLRTLRRMQAERDKALAAMHPAAMERAGYWFYISYRYFNGLLLHNPDVPGSILGYGKLCELGGPSAAHQPLPETQPAQPRCLA
jgi:hypothetical protein